MSTPVFIGSEPSNMALSDDGQIMYVLATGSGQIVRYNVLTRQPGFSYQSYPSYNQSVPLPRFAVQPGTENTVALVQSQTPLVQIIDFDPVSSTTSVRPVTGGARAAPRCRRAR